VAPLAGAGVVDEPVLELEGLAELPELEPDVPLEKQIED